MKSQLIVKTGILGPAMLLCTAELPAISLLIVVNIGLFVRCSSAQLELKAAQIRVKVASSSLNETRDYLDKLPEHVKDVEKALAPLKK